MALTLAGDDRVDEEAVDANHPDAAAPLAGGARLVSQLVALGSHREPPFELLDRVVARVRDQTVDGVEPVAAGPAAVRALVDLEVDPVLLALGVEAGVGDEVQVRRVAGRDLLRHDAGERSQDEVDRALDLTEAGEAGARVVRVEDRSLRGDHLDGLQHPLVLRHEDRVRGLVEEDHPDDERHRGNRRPLVRAVVAGRHLVARAGQVDRQLVAVDDHLHLHG